MDLDTWPNLVAMLFDQAARRDETPFLWEKRDGAYRATSWGEAVAQVSALARALKAYGLGPGERVVLLSENAPHWAVADFAIMAAGGVTVPAYTTNTARDHAHILADSGATMAVVSTAALAAPLLEAAAATKTLTRVIAIEPPRAPAHVAVSGWDEALAEGAGLAGDPAADAASIDRDSLACIIYTSGTGGAPKGVMLSHRAILANCVGAQDLLRELGLGDEVFLSFLPLSHAYEHSCGLMFPVSIGAQIYYAEGVEALTTNLVESRPTLMTAVPRLYEVMRTRILHGVRRAGGLKARLFWRAVELGRKRYEDGTLTLVERALDALLERLVRDKVRARFGGRLKALVSGGAPLNYEVGVFFTALGLRLLQGYGQTEAAPVVSCNPARRVKLRTVGPPITGTEVKIADDGEILVRGPLLMDGYWNQKRASAEALRDGWLHTGDVGVIDADGYVQITDRKKDIIVNSAGDNISPQRVEGMLVLEPEVEQAMVTGDGRPHLVALVVPSAAFVEEWARAHGAAADLAALSGNEAFHKALAAGVERANAELSVIEKVRRFAIATPFTVENGTMTPTMKVRRHEIVKRYGAALEALY
jgi:long-chain acyl-CoA synthetase